MAIDFTIQDLVNKSVREKEEKFHEKTSWWPTDLGKCLTGAYYRRLGIPPDKEFDDRLLRVFRAGNLFEEFIISLLKKQTDDFQTQVRLVLEERDLTGYADLVINGLVYELKSIHSQGFWKIQRGELPPHEHYFMQLYCGMMALGKDEGRLVYISKDDLSILEFPLLSSNEHIRRRVYEDLEKLNYAWEHQQPPDPPPTIINGKLNWQVQYCSYHSTCLHNTNWLNEASKIAKPQKRERLQNRK